MSVGDDYDRLEQDLDAPALSPLTSTFDGQALSRWKRATGSPWTSNMTRTASLRRAAGSSARLVPGQQAEAVGESHASA